MVYVIIQEEAEKLDIIGFTWDTARVTELVAEWLTEIKDNTKQEEQ